MSTQSLRPIYEIAGDISRTWKKVNYAAKPYLDAMHSLGTVKDMYGCDHASNIILYFLSNASSFRGEQAKALKAELKAHLG